MLDGGRQTADGGRRTLDGAGSVVHRSELERARDALSLLLLVCPISVTAPQPIGPNQSRPSE